MGEPIPVTIKFDEDRYNEDKRVFVVKMSLPASWAAKPAAKPKAKKPPPSLSSGRAPPPKPRAPIAKSCVAVVA